MAGALAKLSRGKKAAATDRDWRMAEELLTMCGADGALEAAVLRAVSRPGALLRAFTVADRAHAPSSLTAEIVDVVLRRGER